MRTGTFAMARPNRNYESDIEHVVSPNRMYLRALGACYSMKNEKSTLGKFTRKRSLIALYYFVLIFYAVPTLLYATYIEKNVHATIMRMPVLIYGVMALVKYSYILAKEKDIAICMKHVEEDWQNVENERDRTVMWTRARQARRLLFACGLLIYFSGFFNRVVLPLSRGTVVTADNRTIRPLPCHGYYVLFDPQASPMYDFVYFMQCLAGFIAFSLTTVICGLVSLFVTHACGQLEILARLMRDIVENAVDVGVKKEHERLSLVVRHQMRVRDFLQMVERTMQQVSFLDLIVNMFCVTFGAYYATTTKEKIVSGAFCTYCITITVCATHIFMYCFVGEQLTLQNDKVAITSTTLEWYRLPDRKARSLVVIMAISHFPLKVTAGSIIELSFHTFGQVMKTCAVYCNILRTVT